MKANNGTGNTSSRDEWQTPDSLFSRLNKQYSFSFDCCATKENAKCLGYSSDFLSVERVDGCPSWMNLPFSKASAMFEHFFGIVDTGVAIYRCDNMETKVWQKSIFPIASWIFILAGRVKFDGFVGSNPRFPVALIGFNTQPPIQVDGVLLKTNQ